MDIWQGSECVSGSEYARVLNILGFWKWQGCTGFKMSLNNSWICLILPGHAWIFMNMPEYAGICVNLPTSSWITCYPLSTLSISTKFIVWRNMRLFFSRDKIWLQSWTKCSRQIHKTEQNRFFYGMFYADFLRFFTKKRQNLAIGWTTGYSSSNPSI